MISHIFNLKQSESRMLYNEIIANCKNDDQWPLVFGDFKVTKEIISLTPENRRICKKTNELFVSGCHLLPILGVFYNNVSFVDAKDYVLKGFVVRPYINGIRARDPNLFPSRYSNKLNCRDKKYLFDRIYSLAFAPQSHYDDFVENFKRVSSAGFITSVNDVVYDSFKGFFFTNVKESNRNICDEGEKREFIIRCFSLCHSVSPCEKSLLSEDEYNRLKKCNLLIFTKCLSALIEKNIGVMNIKNAFIKQELEGIVFNPVTIWGLDPASLDEILGQMIGKTIIRN